MKLSSWLSASSMAALAMAATGALAQDTPPATDPQKQAQEPEEKPTPVKWNEISIAYSSFSTNPGLSYYARPAEGLTIYNLRLLEPLGETKPYARLIYRGVPQQDNLVDGFIALNRGRTTLRGTRTQTGYYVFDWRPKDKSEDKETKITLDHSFTPRFGGFVTYRANERDGRYPAPRDPDHTRTTLVGGGVGGNVLGGNLGVTVASRKTSDDTNAQPETIQRKIDASYSRDFGDTFSLEGNAGYARIEQAGLPNSGIRTYSLAGSWDLGPATGLTFRLGRQDLDLDAVQNAYVRKRLLTSARLVHHWPGWSFQFGFQHKESERLRSDQSFVDVPKSNVYDARLAGRLGPARLTLKGSWEDLRTAAVMQTSDARRLQWDDRANFQAKLEGGSDKFSAYTTYTYRFQQNQDRDVEIGWHNIVFGGSYVFNDTLNGYAEFASDTFRVIGRDESGQTLDFYFPNSRSFALGLNWSKDPSLSASASLNNYESGDARGTQLTFSLHRKLGPDHDLDLVVAPWRLEDRLLDLTGYRTTFLMARYTVRF